MQCSTEVLTVLDGLSIAGNAVKIVEQLDRTLYQQVNTVLEAAGGRWNTKAKAHLFEADPTEILDYVQLTGAIDTRKDTDFDFFETPLPLALSLLDRAQFRAGMHALEPSAGRGAIAGPMAKRAVVDCVELSPERAAYLKDLSTMRSVQNMDFLAMSPLSVYDRVVMNPPFSKQQDIRHVLHASRFLKPGGLLVAVMAAGVTFRKNRLAWDFRERVAGLRGSIEALPTGIFKASGVHVSTVVVTIPG